MKLTIEEKMKIALGDWNLTLLKKIETLMKRELEDSPDLVHKHMKLQERRRSKK